MSKLFKTTALVAAMALSATSAMADLVRVDTCSVQAGGVFQSGVKVNGGSCMVDGANGIPEHTATSNRNLVRWASAKFPNDTVQYSFTYGSYAGPGPDGVPGTVDDRQGLN